MNRGLAAGIGGLAVLGAVAACGSSGTTPVAAAAPASTEAVADSGAAAGSPTGDPMVPNTPAPDFSYIPGMAMGAPPQTVQLLCSGNSCDAVFIPPSSEKVSPFGLAVTLVKSDTEQAVISVAGKQYVVKPGKSVRIKGVTASLTRPPGAVVNLNFRKGAAP